MLAQHLQGFACVCVLFLSALFSSLFKPLIPLSTIQGVTRRRYLVSRMGIEVIRRREREERGERELIRNATLFLAAANEEKRNRLWLPAPLSRSLSFTPQFRLLL